MSLKVHGCQDDGHSAGRACDLLRRSPEQRGENSREDGPVESGDGAAWIAIEREDTEAKRERKSDNGGSQAAEEVAFDVSKREMEVLTKPVVREISAEGEPEIVQTDVPTFLSADFLV
jgi:hypothetical protein